MTKSIRYYIFTSIAAVLVISMLGLGLIQTYLSSAYYRNDKERLLLRVVSGVTRGVQTGELEADGSDIHTVSYMAHIADAVVIIADAQGLIWYSSDRALPLEQRYITPDLLQKLDEDSLYSELGQMDGLFENRYYSVAAPIRVDGSLYGYVIASTDASGLSVYLSDIMSGFVMSAALVILVASLLALYMTNRIVVPIQRIGEAARQFGEGVYSARVPVEGDNELAQLAISFNEMANSLEATDISRRSFMGNIAHELRTPMTSIKGFIDGILDGTIPPDQQPKYLAIVSDEVGRLARLTKSMLDISRLEAGEQVANKTIFNIWSPITAVLISAEQRLDEKQVTLKGLDDCAPTYVLADEDFVHQVVYNLMDNAMKFTPDGGEITVAMEPQRNQVVVSVQNSGTGVPPETLQHIFERFYKADKSRSNNVRGAGLGLHICRVLVGMMGGRIWAESDSESWTRFSFTLPMAPPQKRTISQRERTASATAENMGK